MLKEINFRNSIRGEVIQENFDFLDSRIRRESLLVGGKGIIEGLTISIINKETIRVSSGSFIDHDGREIHFEGKEFKIKPIEPISKTTERLPVNKQGEVILPFRPYSKSFKGYYDTEYYNYNYPTDEFVIRSATDGTRIKASAINGATVTIDANQWGNRSVYVDYLYARNRMDTVMINGSGVHIATGTMSASISHADEEDYSEYFVIGMIETVIEKEQSLVHHSAERQDRNIYVDKDGVLFLDGKPYRRVYFIMPEDPMVHDIYIDTDKARVYVYDKTTFGYEWVLVNTSDVVPRREVKIFSHEECPEDLQTFMFDEEMRNLFFTPGENQLEIIIDNAPVMSDQFEEIGILTEDRNNGRGFKLKEPLDKPAFVEVRVMNVIQNAPANRVFQRTSTFTKESLLYKDVDNYDAIFEAPIQYIAGEYQLEVYVDGKRLIRDVEFLELDDTFKKATGGQQKYFKVLVDLIENQIITCKVTKNIYTYDHIGEILESSIKMIEETAAEARKMQSDTMKELEQLKKDFATERSELNRRIIDLERKNQSIEVELQKMSDFVSKEDKIEASQLHDNIKKAIAKESFEMTAPCQPIVTLNGLDGNDHYVIHLIKSTGGRPLMKGIDYTATAVSGGLLVTIDENVVDSSATLFVSGIKIGI